MPAEPPVRNIARVADALEAMAAGCNRLTLIAGHLGVSKSSVHRILKSMEAAGLAVQDPLDGGYYIGPRIVALTGAVSASHQYLSINTRPEIETLGRELGETVLIAVRAGLEKVVVEEVMGGSGARISVGRGYISTLALGATGRMLLAQLEAEELDALLPLLAPDRDEAGRLAIRGKIDEAGRAGFNISRAEYLQGVCAIAVPVRCYAAPVVMSTLAHAEKTDARRSAHILARMQESVDRIERKLSHALTRFSGAKPSGETR